jgi:hypothetical protein
MAYTLVDLDSAAAPEVVARISRIPACFARRARCRGPTGAR